MNQVLKKIQMENKNRPINTASVEEIKEEINKYRDMSSTFYTG
ncbi:MAG: hypothetical protein ACOCV8_00770 [Spirochaetota bacterium]